MGDSIFRGTSTDGSIRVFAADTTVLANRAQEIHHSYPVSTAALGRVLTIAAIMGATLKNETDTTTIQFCGDGPIGKIVVVTDSRSRVRGYSVNPFVELPLNKKGKLDVGKAVGRGYLSVIRDLGMKEPYIGQVPIVTGEIAEDITYYYAASEQTPTAIGLGVLVDTDNSVISSGGFMLQLMPEADEEAAAKLEDIIKSVPSVTVMMQDGLSPMDIIFRITEGFDIVVENNPVTPEYYCPCSRKRMENALISIGKTEIQDIIDTQGQAEMTCQFCDNKYVFTKEDLESLLLLSKRK